jgi:uncharacterized protein (DUF2235 family)
MTLARNLIVCCDGTNNQFGPENTSVVRLVQVLDRDPKRQLLYYDPGLGTLPEPGWLTRLGQTLARWLDLALATGLGRKVQEAYIHLMDFWEPGDQVYLFGFSRGAYTARVLAGLLHTLGLLPRGNHNLVPYVMRLFAAIRSEGRSKYWKLCDEFRWTFARPVPGGADRRFRVHFLGLWDTVSSVGWVWDPATYPFTACNPGIDVIRHAVAVDERRWFFRQNLISPAEGQDCRELWFPGVHGDVGGGYPDQDGGLWRVPFEWLLNEAAQAGLSVDAQRLNEVLHHTQSPVRPWAEPQHESLRGLWWLAELFPKLRRAPGSSLLRPRIGGGRYRYIPNGALIAKATLLRIRETRYVPPNLSKDFLAKVRGLAEVPEAMGFQW